jgi:hypothetical protein
MGIRELAAMPLTIAMLVQAPAAQAPAPEQPAQGAAGALSSVGTVDDLMLYVLYPMADSLFYISPDPAPTEAEWKDLQAKSLMLAEAGNLLMMPSRLGACCAIPKSIQPTTDVAKWTADAQMLVTAGKAAFEATKKQDVDAVLALNEQLYNACVQCHADFRPDYGRRPIGPASR